jgi:hypothetical protein
VVAGAVLGPVGAVYASVDDRNGLARGYEPGNSLLPTDLLTPQRDNWLWGTALDGINSAGKAGEHAYFPGVLGLTLGFVGLVVGFRLLRRGEPTVRTGIRLEELLAIVVAGGVAFVLALGPSPGGGWGPFRLLHRFVPGFDGIRVTSRFAAITFVAAALLIGLAVQFIVDRWPQRGSMLAPLIALVIVAEVAGPMARVTVPEGEHRLVYEALAGREEGVVLELPIRAPADGVAWAFVEAPRMYHATIDWNPRVNGYSGSAPRGFEEVVAVLNRWPDTDARDLAADLGVRYIVLHGGIEQGTAAYSSATLEFLVAQSGAQGFETTPHGEDWLVDLG